MAAEVEAAMAVVATAVVATEAVGVGMEAGVDTVAGEVVVAGAMEAAGVDSAQMGPGGLSGGIGTMADVRGTNGTRMTRLRQFTCSE